MKYILIRHDGEKDNVTDEVFSSYDEAYDLLENIYSDICCSDADYEDRPYYEIIQIKD
tara:strand:- start:150 stop:323 length:174 start_codon:yes stop_codon:yes gene_type:complete